MSRVTAVDRAILNVAPGWGARRIAARARAASLERAIDSFEPKRRRRRSYKAASGGRRTAGWHSPATSARAETRQGTILRHWARELERNNAYANKAARVLVSRMVGTGFMPSPQHPDEGIVRELSALWNAWWTDPDQVDADGVLSGAGIQAQLVRGMVSSGEAICRRRRRRASDDLVVPMQLQLLEPDHIDDSRDVLTATGSRIFQGIELNARGRRTAFHLFRDHPGDVFQVFNFESVPVPARDVLHLFRPDRIGQLRGIPWGVAAFLRLRDVTDFIDGELMRQKIASSFVGFVTGPGVDDDSFDLGKRADSTAYDELEDVQEFEPGTLTKLPLGTEVKFGTPQPFEVLSDYVKIGLREVAAAYGTSYEALTGDLEKVSFSGGRLGWIEFTAEVDAWRAQLIVPALNRIWRWFLDAAVLAGRVPARARRMEMRMVPASWTPPRREYIRPEVDVKALLDQLDAGLISYAEAALARGMTREELFRELKADREAAERHGLALASPGLRGPGTSSADEPPEDPDEGVDDPPEDPVDDGTDADAA